MGAEQLIGLGDLLVERKLAEEEVRTALSCILSVPLAEIRVVQNDEFPSSLEWNILCQIRLIEGGDFHTHLSPYEVLSKALPTIPLVVNLCRNLKCRCLIGDETVNPFTFYLVDETGEWRHVGIDPDREEAGEFVLTDWQCE